MNQYGLRMQVCMWGHTHSCHMRTLMIQGPTTALSPALVMRLQCHQTYWVQPTIRYPYQNLEGKGLPYYNVSVRAV